MTFSGIAGTLARWALPGGMSTEVPRAPGKLARASDGALPHQPRRARLNGLPVPVSTWSRRLGRYWSQPALHMS